MDDIDKLNIESQQGLVSIGITCFNAHDSISRAIKSAQEQSYENIEILVVDDGSSDGSIEVVEQIANKDPRVNLIKHEKNAGTAVARNTLVSHAKGEFITFFDDDDLAMHDRVERQVDRLVTYEKQSGADTVFCYCDRNVVLEGETRTDHVGFGIGRKEPEPSGEIVADFILWRVSGRKKFGMGQMGSGTMLLRLNAFEKLGPFNESFRRSAEIELAIRAAQQGAHFISVPEPLIVQNKTQTSDKANRKPLDYALLLRETHESYLKKKGLYKASRALAYAQFWANQGQQFKSRAYMLLACLCAPHKIVTDRIKLKLGGT